MSLNISGASKTITINFNPQISTFLTNKLGAASSQWWVKVSQEIYCWDSNGKVVNGCFVDFYSWYGWTFTEVMTNHNSGSTKQGNRIMTISANTSSSELYIGLKKTYNSVYVDDNNSQPIWPISASESNDSKNVPASLSEGTVQGTGTSNPYGITSSDWQQIYKVTVTSNKTVTVTKGN